MLWTGIVRTRALLVASFLLACDPAEPASTSPESPRAPEETPLEVAPVIERVRHEVVADGHPLAVWEKRPAEPKGAILLVHGRTWSSIPDFDLQVEGEELSLMDALVDAGWAAYAIDLRGYGETPRDQSGWLTPNRAVADVAVVLEWIATRHPDASKPALFGWSRGSMVAQLCAQRHAGLLSDLILFGYPTDPDRKYEKQAPPLEPPRQATTAKAAASDFITPGTISERAIAAYVEASLAADPVRADWMYEHEFAELDPTRVHSPTLVMHGEHDPFVHPEAESRLFERLGNADRRWVVLAGADHAAHLETARPQFLEALLGFLERAG